MGTKPNRVETKPNRDKSNTIRFTKSVNKMNPMNSMRKTITDEDGNKFDCNPNGNCWCKEESFPQLPIISRDKCLSPQQIQKIRDTQDEILKAPNFESK